MSVQQKTDNDHQQHVRDPPIPGAGAIEPQKDAAKCRGLEELIAEILRRSDIESLDDFLTKALDAYEGIIAAFDRGAREELRTLLSPDVYNLFSDAIAIREAERRFVETVFSRIEQPEIIDAVADAAHVELSIRFAGECFKLSRGTDGQLVDKARGECRTIDIWTFSRTLSSGDGSWILVATAVGA
jgi:predicted lipid-binding transport protein (Tim44 family)